jgi:hypothetical protein
MPIRLIPLGRVVYPYFEKSPLVMKNDKLNGMVLGTDIS